ncbi:UDP-2,3-diacylglucosamine diphosphatase [Ahniella affigens]|uniref:UDP-2,3-diacylglucosamine hydrolase n=1 Tax=Ahniella affigens TaxID=2021234 RepID=A0A2P1PS32_9GAMM|nr:UDP-2,3-diacylglucosamine diphosphatase [Ahniella affigens]AVP97657.1 UDP-2,3-diacylglucosamine diphosphatase [Ahniella affigens]
MTTYFISDLHLQESRPAATESFAAFLQEIRDNAAALYILGDLFEVWVGDDDDAPFALSIQAMLKQQTQSHPVYFVHGNRDFLIGPAFAAATGVTLLPDETRIDLNGQPTLLLHGDTLCTDDLAYQAFRRTSREPVWQAALLAQPLAARRAFALQARAASQEAMKGKSEAIMDANLDAVRAAFTKHACAQMIHGHTHRPAVHDEQAAMVGGRRVVLGDWYEQGSVLCVSPSGLTLRTRAFPPG